MSPAYPPQSLHLFIHHLFNLSSTMYTKLRFDIHICITIRISMPNTHNSLYTKHLNITRSTQSINVKIIVM